MSTDYKTQQERHMTIRVVVAVIAGMVALIAMVGGFAFTAHENNEKTTKYGVECMKNGGEWRERNNGEAYCDN